MISFNLVDPLACAKTGVDKHGTTVWRRRQNPGSDNQNLEKAHVAKHNQDRMGTQTMLQTGTSTPTHWLCSPDGRLGYLCVCVSLRPAHVRHSAGLPRPRRVDTLVLPEDDYEVQDMFDAHLVPAGHDEDAAPLGHQVLPGLERIEANKAAYLIRNAVGIENDSSGASVVGRADLYAAFAEHTHAATQGTTTHASDSRPWVSSGLRVSVWLET